MCDISPGSCKSSYIFRKTIKHRSNSLSTPDTLSLHAKIATRSSKREKYAGKNVSKTHIITISPDASDLWRLDPVIDLINQGAVGIIPTDSCPALICDVANKNAVQLLYEVKGAPPSQRLSILCGSLAQIALYTTGWPSYFPFKLVKQLLPGPYTMILNSSKAMPKNTVSHHGKSKRQETVGVRLVDHPVCQHILNNVERPLLCTTAKVPINGSSDDIMQLGGVGAAGLADYYGPRGLAFVVDEHDDGGGGREAVGLTTVIDLTGAEPVVIREGKGDISFLEV
jgi:tRNA threonylcarbamoyl adenosine modification protein (Sua5/YciO/YrdC/YwlC family)